MHHGTKFDDPRWKRDLQKATVYDIANFLRPGRSPPHGPTLVLNEESLTCEARVTFVENLPQHNSKARRTS
jgi:hypothetical protein